jgi:hypothetical protein
MVGRSRNPLMTTEENAMTNPKLYTTVLPRAWLALLVALLVALACAPVFAGAGGGPRDHSDRHERKGYVVPANTKVYGYSLYDMARATAAFNVTNRAGPVPNTPFQILFARQVDPSDPDSPLVTTFKVGQGRFLYVPVAYNDTSMPVIGNFPKNAEHRKQLLKYWYSQSEFGTVATEIIVNGKVTPLGGDYVAGVNFPTPLPDGATQYATPAAFIAPLPVGTHTVEIHFKATGDALREPPIDQYFPDGFFEFSLVYTVHVY